MTTFSLPFALDRDEIRGHDAAHAIRGVVRLEDEAVVIRYTIRHGTVGGAQVDPHETTPERVPEALDVDVGEDAHAVRIMLRDVVKFVMMGGIVRSPRLVIDVRDAAALASLPWADGTSCMMRMRRAHGQTMREWLVEAELRLARIRTGDRFL
jgi:hypothetical protein